MLRLKAKIRFNFRKERNEKMNNVLNNMLAQYDIKNTTDEINAMKEIIQEIVICGLSRGGFFNEAAFYGGTALRIFYGLNRFSEDLDFALIEPNKKFDLSKYFSFIEREVMAYGLNLKIMTKEGKCAYTLPIQTAKIRRKFLRKR